ncbi:MAG: SufB/SufD family protein [Syntrophomonadaceae bacterium]|jgi:Fe-S cluster assembly scaffold protein SufB
MELNQLDRQLLDAIADIKELPSGAINIRRDGQAIIRRSSSNIKIDADSEKPGIMVEVKPGTVDEVIHVPVILTAAGFRDQVFNTFIIGEGSRVTIIAGCGIHNSSHSDSRHDGIHKIVVEKGAHLKYQEKHYGEGQGKGKRILNPVTEIIVHDDGAAELELHQIKGVDDTNRTTVVYLHRRANIKIIERLLTHDNQNAESDIKIFIQGNKGTAQVFSRTVAKDNSTQVFKASIMGETECFGHVECDSIIMDRAKIKSIPELIAQNSEAVLTHEAAIGKIAGEQLIKLMSLGLTEQEAMDTILNGFLK